MYMHERVSSHFVCLSIRQPAHPPAHLSVHPPSIPFSVHPPSIPFSVHPSVHLSIRPSVPLSVCLSVRLSVCLSVKGRWLTFRASKRHELKLDNDLASLEKTVPFECTLDHTHKYKNGKVSSHKTRITCLFFLRHVGVKLIQL